MNSTLNKNILLLTATIQPSVDQSNLRLADPQERLNDYNEALSYYAGLLEKGVVDGVVFVDNSGFDLGPLKNTYQSENIEWISFYDLDYPSNYHRGYGEFRLIDHAFRESKTFGLLGESDVIWKVTGRYVIKNIKTFIRMAPAKFDFYCNARKRWVDMEIMAWTTSGYEAIVKDVWKEFATEMPPELILADIIRAASHKSNRIIHKYYWPPTIIGRRGGDGSSFQGRFTPIRLSLTRVRKLVIWPFRYFVNRIT